MLLKQVRQNRPASRRSCLGLLGVGLSIMAVGALFGAMNKDQLLHRRVSKYSRP